jgi:two-component system sensor histidine kinase/response regulator
METLRLLVVDDEPGIRAGINRALQDYTVSFPFFDDDFNFEIINTDSGEEAIKILDSRPVDIVLLDNKLPGIEGIEVLEYIKERSMDAAVMMITSYASMELAIRATNNGAFNFIPKPFSARDLKTAVESITKHLFLKRMTRKMKTEARQIRFKFLSVLSHELKSPINAIEGYLRIMKDRPAGNDIRTYEHMIERSLTRIESMRGLIMDMLDLTRIESSSKNRILEQHDLVEIAKLAIDSFNPVAIQMNVKIIAELPETLFFLCDTTEIEIIFNNLLSNAVKYNRVNGQVFFRIRDTVDRIAIEVEDTGIGMTEEEQSMLFREFSRIRTEKTKYISGSGLGLSIMKRIVELYRGRVHVKSIPDNGTTFIVELSQNGSLTETFI